MALSDFYAACQALASSAGEFALWLVVALVSYLAVAVRSLSRKLAVTSRTSSASGFAPARRASRGPRGPRSSSARPAGSAASPLQPSPPKEVDLGLPQQTPLELASPVERFIQSIPSDLAPLGAAGRSSADGPNPVGRTPEPERGADHGGADDAGGSAASGIVLGLNRS